ncbi:hypothetical protein [Bacillus sp. EB600]|nr:hypothetical protein [Bacillus sp. EB600]MCQ6279863.1 hypothetical protein [Bacillus sp. EB600]
MKEQKSPTIPNEEFSVEFGDVNGMKLYEFPFSSKKNHKKTSNKNIK